MKQVVNLRQLAEWSGLRYGTLRRMWERNQLPGAIPVARVGARERLVAVETFCREMGFRSPFDMKDSNGAR